VSNTMLARLRKLEKANGVARCNIWAMTSIPRLTTWRGLIPLKNRVSALS
jgi:hypothetical protein